MTHRIKKKTEENAKVRVCSRCSAIFNFFLSLYKQLPIGGRPLANGLRIRVRAGSMSDQCPATRAQFRVTELDDHHDDDTNWQA